MSRILLLFYLLGLTQNAVPQSIKIYGESGPNRWDLIADGDHNPHGHPATDFGTILAGESLTHNFRIENPSSVVIQVAGFQSDNSAFRAQVPPSAQQLDPGETVDFFIRFDARAGEVSARMRVGYAAFRQPLKEYEFSLVGEGERPVIYVDATAMGNDDGSSWTDAYSKLQDALVAVRSGSEPIIRVAEGVYFPDRGMGQILGDRTSTFTVKKGVSLLGGYPSGGGSASPGDHPTILSGDLDGNDFNSDGNHISESPDHTVGANAYSVVTVQGDALIRGLVITAGLADGVDETSQVAGAGIYVSGFAADVFVLESSITGCAAKRSSADDPPAAGAAIYLGRRGSLTVRDSAFSNNALTDHFSRVIDGGLIAVENGDCIRIEDSEFSDNLVGADLAGGAGTVYLIAAGSDVGGVFQIDGATITGHRLPEAALVGLDGIHQATLSRCAVFDNFCAHFAIFHDCGSARLESSAIHGNVLQSQVSFDGTVNFTAINVTTAGNQVDSVFDVLSDGASGSIAITNSVFATPLETAAQPLGAGFEIIRQNSLVPGFGADGEGNLDPATAPMFQDPVSASLAPSPAGDYRLRDDSPLIEAGREAVSLGRADLTGMPRSLDWDFDGQLRPDIGAYESTRPAIIDEVIHDPDSGEVTLVARSVGDGRYIVEHARSLPGGSWLEVGRGTLRPGSITLKIPGWRYGWPRGESFFRIRIP